MVREDRASCRASREYSSRDSPECESREYSSRDSPECESREYSQPLAAPEMIALLFFSALLWDEAGAWGFKDGVLHNSIWLERAAGVYHREARSGKYRLTYAEAKAVCEYEGGHLATYQQLEAARKIGGEFRPVKRHTDDKIYCQGKKIKAEENNNLTLAEINHREDGPEPRRTKAPGNPHLDLLAEPRTPSGLIC